MASVPGADASFTAHSKVHAFSGVLFDFDGTIIDSTDAITKHWQKLGRELGIDPSVILATSHGRRSIDVLQLYDSKKANWNCEWIPQKMAEQSTKLAQDVSFVEGLIPKEFGQDAVEIPGARKLLSSLDSQEAPWAIVTSGTKALITGWIEVMKLAQPKHMVVAEDVQIGKPDPTCYSLGCQRLGLQDEGNMLVVEDAPAGIRAGKAAGFKVVGLLTTHHVEQIKEAGADWIVRDLRSLAILSHRNRRIHVEIRDELADEAA